MLNMTLVIVHVLLDVKLLPRVSLVTQNESAKFLGGNLANHNMTLSCADEKTLSTTNLGNFGATNAVSVDVVNSHTLSINCADTGDHIFTGSGSIVGNTIEIDCVVEFNDQTRDTCQAIVTQ